MFQHLNFTKHFYDSLVQISINYFLNKQEQIILLSIHHIHIIITLKSQIHLVWLLLINLKILLIIFLLYYFMKKFPLLIITIAIENSLN